MVSTLFLLDLWFAFDTVDHFRLVIFSPEGLQGL